MATNHDRKVRENKTIESMIKIYCYGQHGTRGKFCAECDNLLKYAMQRVSQCKLGENKTTCAKCPVHCYKPIMRERIKKIMRYARPRMLYRHPILAALHFLDGLKKSRSGPAI